MSPIPRARPRRRRPARRRTAPMVIAECLRVCVEADVSTRCGRRGSADRRPTRGTRRSRPSTRCPRSRSRASPPTSGEARSRRTSAEGGRGCASGRRRRCRRGAWRSARVDGSVALDSVTDQIVGMRPSRERRAVRSGFALARRTPSRTVSHLAGFLADRSWSPRPGRGYVQCGAARSTEKRRRGSMTDSIASRIRSGVAWKAGSQLTLQVSRMAVALILARLLAPEDWGLAAMVLVFSGIVVVFTDSALGTALIQRRTIVEEDRSTVFWTSAVIGLVLMLAGIGLSGPLARFYGEPEVAALFAVVSVGFLVSSLGATQQALLVRDMRFNRLELRQIAATVVGAAVGITVALAGFGAWAIVAQLLAEAAVSTVLLWYLAEWWPSAVYSFASLRRPRRLRGQRVRREPPLPDGPEHRQPADGPLPRGVVARPVRARDEHRPRPVLPHRRPAPAGLLPRLRADERRPPADGGHLDPRDAPRRGDLDPGARRPRDRRSRLRRGRPRAEVVRCDPRHPDPRAGRAHPVAPDALRRSAARRRPGELASPVHDAVVRREPRLVRHRRPVGRERGGGLLRDRNAPGRAGADVHHRPRARDVGVEIRRGAERHHPGRRGDGRVPARRPVGPRRGGRAGGRTSRDSSLSRAAVCTSFPVSGGLRRWLAEIRVAIGRRRPAPQPVSGPIDAPLERV